MRSLAGDDSSLGNSRCVRIVIGIVTVTLMGTAIEGLNRAFRQSISALGADVLYVARFGWFIDSVEGHKNIGHGGSTSGFSASIQRFPEEQLAVIVLTNTDEQIATILAKKIATPGIPCD